MQDRLSGFRMVNLEGKRKILGYDCRKALMIHEASGDSAEVWYTRELPPMKVASGEFLPRMDDYFPMEVTSRKDGIELTMRLREIQLVQVDKRFFELPSGYTIVDQDEIQKGLQLLSTP